MENKSNEMVKTALEEKKREQEIIDKKRNTTLFKIRNFLCIYEESGIAEVIKIIDNLMYNGNSDMIHENLARLESIQETVIYMRGHRGDKKK